MNKKMWLAIFLLPAMRSGTALLRNLDANSTGGDDEAAEAIDFAIARLDKWLAS
jgi:hypothetical protein